MNERAFLTPEEAAAILRVHFRTVYRLLRSGRIEGVKFGRLWRVPRAQFQREAK